MPFRINRRAFVTGIAASTLAAPSIAQSKKLIERASLRFQHEFMDGAPIKLDLTPVNAAAFAHRGLMLHEDGQIYRVLQDESAPKPSNLMFGFTFADDTHRAMTLVGNEPLGPAAISITRRVQYHTNMEQRLSVETLATMGLEGRVDGLVDIGIEADHTVDFEHVFKTGRVVMTYKVRNAPNGLSVQDADNKVDFVARGDVTVNGPPTTTFVAQQPIPARHTYGGRFALFAQGATGPERLFALPDPSHQDLVHKPGDPSDVFHAEVITWL